MKTKVVDAPFHKAVYGLLPDGGLFFEKTHIYWGLSNFFDSFSNLWVLASADMPPGVVSIRTRGKLIPLAGPSAILFTPFTIINWVIHSAKEVQWRALTYRLDKAPDLPREACLFPLPKEEWPESFEDIKGLFKRDRSYIPVDKIEKYSHVALKLRKMINRNYMRDIDVSEYSKEFGISHDLLARYFKASFGLPPIEYRNQLRLFQAMHDVLFDSAAITDVSEQVGFRNLRNFNKLFVKNFKIPPSLLRL